MRSFYIFILFSLFFFVSVTDARGAINPDSVSTKSSIADTALAHRDTLQKKSDIDSVIYADGRDSLVFFITQKRLKVYGGGDLRYKATRLKSGKIDVDFGTSNVLAEGKPNDTVQTRIDETPVMIDKGEEYKGTRMTYNFKSTRGYITFASTKSDATAYSGARINKVDSRTFFVQNGFYTTCDAPHPHFGFYGREMKVVQKEQLVGKWIWLTFENVPFPIPAPFAVIALQSGRRSGIIVPAYGERGDYGKYFSHLGYYWAISDYTDWVATTDLYTRGGYTLDSRFNYAKRYDFTGSLSGSYSSLPYGLTTDPDYSKATNWRISWDHSQTLTPTSRFDARLQFMSSDYLRQISTNYTAITQNQITSNAAYSKTWEESGTSMSINYSRTQDLNNGNIAEVLPDLRFMKSQFYPFKGSNASANDKWYESFGISYDGEFRNDRNSDTTGLKIHGGIRHQLSPSISLKTGHFNISPSFSYTELWYNKQSEMVYGQQYDTSKTKSWYLNEINKIGMVRTFSTGVSVNTRIYGIAQPQMLGIAAIRHTITPSVSYSYTPDFSKSGWGYFGTYTDSLGNVKKYNKYSQQIFGGPGEGETQALGFRLGNLFEIKTMVDPTDTTSKEKKIQLMNLDASINYNFAASHFRFSDLSISGSTNAAGIFTFRGDAQYSLYDYDEKGNPIDRMLWTNRKQIAWLRSLGLSCDLNLSGDRKETGSRDNQQNQSQTPAAVQNMQSYVSPENRIYGAYYADQPADFSIPWQLSLSYSYRMSRANPYSTEYSPAMSGTFSFNLTQAWKIMTSTSYSFKDKQLLGTSIVVTRDLHCWEMNFRWNPFGYYHGYSLEIRVKAPQLQDLKLTKTDNFFSGRR
ncbi:MAG: LPS-assembly protein LptD [Ignavibacteria bacterium]|nr:LPS-assembly protein LptD [Ignavibacteria bacterium]